MSRGGRPQQRGSRSGEVPAAGARSRSGATVVVPGRSRRHRGRPSRATGGDCKCAGPVTAVTVSAIHRPGRRRNRSSCAMALNLQCRRRDANKACGRFAFTVNPQHCGDAQCNLTSVALTESHTWSPLASRFGRRPTVMSAARAAPLPGCSTPHPDGTADSGDLGDGRLSDVPGAAVWKVPVDRDRRGRNTATAG